MQENIDIKPGSGLAPGSTTSSSCVNSQELCISHVDIPAPAIDLPNIVGQDDARLVPSHIESVTSTPMPIADMIMTAPL